jgi:hypothetical protein
MAQKVQVVLVDDVDGGTAEETVSFALDGVSYEIDLSAKNAAKLREDLASWVGLARRAGGRARRGTRRTAARGGSSADVRAWAKAQGLAVSERGRIPAEIVAQYEAAH